MSISLPSKLARECSLDFLDGRVAGEPGGDEEKKAPTRNVLVSFTGCPLRGAAREAVCPRSEKTLRERKSDQPLPGGPRPMNIGFADAGEAVPSAM